VAGFEFLNPARSSSGGILNTQIQYSVLYDRPVENLWQQVIADQTALKAMSGNVLIVVDQYYAIVEK